MDELHKTYSFDFEDLYGEYGWNVKYESPSYKENFDENYYFTPKTKT